MEKQEPVNSTEQEPTSVVPEVLSKNQLKKQRAARDAEKRAMHDHLQSKVRWGDMHPFLNNIDQKLEFARASAKDLDIRVRALVLMLEQHITLKVVDGTKSFADVLKECLDLATKQQQEDVEKAREEIAAAHLKREAEAKEQAEATKERLRSDEPVVEESPAIEKSDLQKDLDKMLDEEPVVEESPALSIVKEETLYGEDQEPDTQEPVAEEEFSGNVGVASYAASTEVIEEIPEKEDHIEEIPEKETMTEEVVEESFLEEEPIDKEIVEESKDESLEPKPINVGLVDTSPVAVEIPCDIPNSLPQSAGKPEGGLIPHHS